MSWVSEQGRNGRSQGVQMTAEVTQGLGVPQRFWFTTQL